jgi:MFS family permease
MRIGPTRTPVPRQVRLLVAARAVNQLGAFSLAFLTVLLCRAFGASLATAGGISAAFGLATIPSRLLGGRLADRLGRRRTILLGLLGCAAAQLGIATSPGLATAAVCAVLLGLAFELYEPASQAIIADATAPAGRASAYGLLTIALGLGNLGAGLVAAIVGRSDLRWLFVVDAATCLGCALIVRLGLPADRMTQSPAAFLAAAPGPAARGPSAWRDAALLAVTAAGAVFALIYMTMLVALPLSLAAGGIDPASAGLIMAVSTLTLVLARPLLRTTPVAGLNHPAACAAGFLLLGIGVAGYVPAHSLASLLAPTAAWSIGSMLLRGRTFAIVSGLAPPGSTTRYFAVYGLSWGVATAAAPVLATLMIAALGPAALWATASVLCFLMAALQPWLLRARPASAAVAAPELAASVPGPAEGSRGARRLTAARRSFDLRGT